MALTKKEIKNSPIIKLDTKNIYGIFKDKEFEKEESICDLIINNLIVIKETKNKTQNININDICYIPNEVIIPATVLSVFDYMVYMTKYLNIEYKSKKILSSFKIIGFTEDHVRRNIRTLSSSELKLLQMMGYLLSNKKIVLMEEPFFGLDIINSKRIKKIIDKMIDNYSKTVIIISKDTDILYRYSKKLLLLDRKNTLKYDDTNKLLEDIDFLKNNNVPIPKIVEFTNIAKETKKVKIGNHKDIRDLIKDIYKHV